MVPVFMAGQGAVVHPDYQTLIRRLPTFSPLPPVRLRQHHSEFQEANKPSHPTDISSPISFQQPPQNRLRMDFCVLERN